MSNWKLMDRESNTITALVVLCQDYVLMDEEFMANVKVQNNMNNESFWIELAQELYGKIHEQLSATFVSEHEGAYDDCDECGVSEDVVLNFVMNPTHRFDINDIICETVDGWLKHFGHKRFS